MYVYQETPLIPPPAKFLAQRKLNETWDLTECGVYGHKKSSKVTITNQQTKKKLHQRNNNNDHHQQKKDEKHARKDPKEPAK